MKMLCLGNLLLQKREGREGRGITIKWTNNMDGIAMKTKEETEIKRKTGGGVRDQDMKSSSLRLNLCMQSEMTGRCVGI
jgi:hypothetical protein